MNASIPPAEAGHASIILITGATAGFGEATARRFAAEGWRVIITGRRRDRLEVLKRELEGLHGTIEGGTVVHALRFDVRNRQEVARAIAALPAEWSAIDVLVNNAGLALGLAAFPEGDPDDWDTMIDTNVKGLLYVSKAVVPGMVARGSGHLINIGSIAGKDAYAKGNVYCATKHAVDGLSKAMRIDLLPPGIKVTHVAPGAVETEFSRVRFHGDRERAEQAYAGFTPLTGKDVAVVVFFAATQPPHVCLNDIVVTPTAQANSTTIFRK
ncbi:MAG: SDR family NAD(P)-dependent oxidoreductase [Flavobacteriales bacterium]|nr:SDR family NAD(P)-dependent oxidoreductase [Flavobacteriales bacterium]HRO39946.1 SDR family NAD(P)-dependent oxidoreductase [Flavobacteriales bacterium]HRP81829.1 SDR family NAD(P)-dependent oxidoreductase [Flavobacteriales bacterium]